MIQAALPGQNKLQYRQTYFIFFRPIRRKTMFSFFKRKKKPETPETAPEQTPSRLKRPNPYLPLQRPSTRTPSPATFP